MGKMCFQLYIFLHLPIKLHHYKAEDDKLVKLIHVDRYMHHYIVTLCLVMITSLRWWLELGVKIHAYAPY